MIVLLEQLMYMKIFEEAEIHIKLSAVVSSLVGYKIHAVTIIEKSVRNYSNQGNIIYNRLLCSGGLLGLIY